MNNVSSLNSEIFPPFQVTYFDDLTFFMFLTLVDDLIT